MPVEKGNKVKVHYTGTLEDGSVFDSSEGKDPLEFEAGSGQVIKGFDEAILGMEKDEEKEVIIPPAKAYGDYNDQLIKTVTKDALPDGPEPQVGMPVMLTSPDGQQFMAHIKKVGEKEITIDVNHPLAGKTLKFKLKVVEYS